MPRWFTRSSAWRAVLGLSCLAPSAPAWAHRRAGGVGWESAGQQASAAYAASMAAVICLMTAALLGALLYLRWRSRHPMPEPDSVGAALETAESGEPSTAAEWGKPADWWRRKEQGS